MTFQFAHCASSFCHYRNPHPIRERRFPLFTMKFLRRNQHLATASADSKGLRSQSSFSTLSTYSEGSIGTAETHESFSPGALHRRRKGGVVRFDESRNQAYENNVMDHEDVIELWFGRQDIDDFRREHYQTVDATIMMESMRPNSWIKSLQTTYEKLSKSNVNVKDIQKLNRRSWQQSMPVNAVGLENWCVKVYRKDKSKRRETLWKAVQSLQQKGDVVDPEILCRACRKITQTHSLYARHVGQVAWQSQE